VMQSIALLDASIQRTKAKIRELETSLRKSQLKTAGLVKMVDQLKSTLADRETQIAQLNGQVGELQTQVAGLQVTVQQGQDSLSAKSQLLDEDRHEIETVYYVVGTKKQLADEGVIVAKGGVLGLGKTIQLSGRFDDNLFHPLDTHDESVIRAEASKAQVLSSQPISSYQLTIEGKQVELHILNPAEFRKVKHVVIMTAA
jgi:ABC-type transporter Mla subunit MlaD